MPRVEMHPDDCNWVRQGGRGAGTLLSPDTTHPESIQEQEL